jgi:outer membrane lipoprotein-sorting protein
VLLLAISAWAQNADVAHIVRQMTEAQHANRTQSHAYNVVRSYTIYGDDGEKERQVVANVNFLPPGTKSFEITKSSGGMAEHVVRKVLEKEAEVAKDPDVNGINIQNYDFALQSVSSLDGARCYVLAITPKRESKDLIEGRIWVDTNTFLIHRVEGKPTKNPSWWVKDVQLVLTFANVDGMWLQTATQAIAHVRFAGLFKMVSHDITYQQSEAVAEARFGGHRTSQR